MLNTLNFTLSNVAIVYYDTAFPPHVTLRLPVVQTFFLKSNKNFTQETANQAFQFRGWNLGV